MRNAILAFVLALALVGCGTPTATTPAPPNSPQTTVALTVKTIADADLAGVKTVIALRDAAKAKRDASCGDGTVVTITCTADNIKWRDLAAATVTIENWLAFIANTDKQISAILAKPEPWADQKREILVLLGTVTAPTLATTIDPGAQAVVAQILTLIAQIRTQVQA